jgi:hypothetical protein
MMRQHHSLKLSTPTVTMTASPIPRKTQMRVITQAMGLRLPREGTEKMTNALTNKPSTFLKSMSRNSRISPY